MHTHVYYLLSPLSVACIYVCLGLIAGDWRTHWGSQKKSDSLSPSSHSLSVALHLGMGSGEISPIRIGMSSHVIM